VTSFVPSRRHRRATALAAAAGLVSLAVVAGTTAGAPASAATLFTATFESGASGWSKSGGTWSVVADGSQVLQQGDTGVDRARQFAGSSSWADYAVQARVKPVAFGTGGVAALGARAATSTKMYRLALTGTDRVELQYMNGSAVTTLAGVSRPVATGTWYTLRIETDGTSVSGWVDGALVGTASDPTLGAGRIALFTGHASARFDDVTVNDGTGTPPTTPPASPTASPTSTPTPGPTPTDPGEVPWSNSPDGFASLPGNGRGPTTGGAGGQTVTVTNLADLTRYVTAVEPYVIRVANAITITPKGTELRVSSNKTIVGVGTAGHIVGGGFFLRAGVSNVIIRNLTIRDTLMPDDDPGDDSYDYDAIQIDTADHIWIDHNRLSRMNDGLLDSRKDTTNITISWNHFDTNNKTFGIGWTDNVTAQMTVHHNWFQNTNSRNPSADNLAHIHLYNNHLQNVTGYGHFIRGFTKAVIENSYFDTVKDPYYVEAGELVQRGNIVVNSSWGSGKVREKGSAFDPRSFYPYTLHPAADVPALLRTHAGPQASIGN
jgi:pectate lyase